MARIYKIWLGGKTYQHKQEIKSLGFRWLSDRLEWYRESVPENEKEKIEKRRYLQAWKDVKFTIISSTTFCV